MKISFWPVVLASTLLAFIHAAHAAPVCVPHNNSTALRDALAAAAAGNGSATIRVEQGIYNVAPEDWIFAFPPGVDLALLGGYVPNTSCSQRHITASPATPATNTVLDGQAAVGTLIQFSSQARALTAPPFGTFTLEGFEIRNLASQPYGNALVIDWNASDGFSGGIQFRYNWVHDNAAPTTAVALGSGGAIEITNNLVAKNTGPYALDVNSQVSPSRAPWHVVNNTVAMNSAIGLRLNRPDGDALLLNNILHDNAGTDFYADGGVTAAMLSETFYTTAKSASATIDKYAYSQTNAAVYDAGFHALGSNNGAPFAALLPAQDLEGNPRWIGSKPERGAFENNVDDQAHFVVTSHLDESNATLNTVTCDQGSPTCTLREAIIRANAAGPSRVDFALGGNCAQSGPEFILLGSRLPEIKNALRINGYSQAGSIGNSAALDAGNGVTTRLCVTVERAAAASVDFALWADAVAFVPQVEVTGILFEGFSSSAIYFGNGAYHWIHGNSFAVAKVDSPFVIANGKGITLAKHVDGAFTSNAQFTTIGGPNPADVNLFAKMNQAFSGAVFLNAAAWNHVGSVVENNLFGVALDAHTPLANAGYGIEVKNSDYNELADNVIVAGAKEGIDLWTANSNWLHGNLIGVVPGGAGNPALGNGGSGIIVTYASTNNAIGAADASGRDGRYSNVIENNLGAGVWIWSGAGTGNSVLDNFIGQNGPGGPPASGGLAIDLGPAGVGLGSVNVPNNAQKAPLLQPSFALGASYLIDFSLSGTGGQGYRIDFYLNSSCDASGYGPAALPISAYPVTLAGAGAQTQTFSVVFPAGSFAQLPAYVSATATHASTNDTSEISNCMTVTIDDRIFSDDLE